MKPYSVDLRERVLAALARGMSRTDAVTTFQVSRSTIKRWLAQYATAGHLRPGRATGRPRTIPPSAEAQLLAQLTTTPDATLAEHTARWNADRPTPVSAWTIGRAIRRLAWPRKKRR
jgi:transposase